MKDTIVKVEMHEVVYNTALKKALDYIYNNNQNFYDYLMSSVYSVSIYYIGTNVYSVRFLLNDGKYEICVSVYKEQIKEKFNSIW